MIRALAGKQAGRYRELVLQQISDGLETYVSTLRPAPRQVRKG